MCDVLDFCTDDNSENNGDTDNNHDIEIDEDDKGKR